MGDNTAARKQLQLHHNPVIDVSLNVQGGSNYIDDDGRPKRTGTIWTACSHMITAVVGSWAMAQLGWIAGPVVMVILHTFFYRSCSPSSLLVSCYRDPVTGKRNCTYSDAVRSHHGKLGVKMCGFIQQLTLFGATIGYTVTVSISLVAIKRSNCFHNSGGKDPCHTSYYPYLLAFGISEIILSQIPNFDKLSWLSIVAAVMSFTYSGIGLAPGVAKKSKNQGSMTGMSIGVVTPAQKMWRTFHALKSPPLEMKTMKKATRFSLAVTSIFYILCGCTGHAAFGGIAPGNLLTDKGLSNPFWLIDIANAAIVIHLVGAYQVFAQPIFALVEKTAAKSFPNRQFITKDIKILIPGFVISMILPFFNDVVGFLGALGYWPLTVYFPVEMYIAQKKIAEWSMRWICLQILSLFVLAVALSAAAGSVIGVVHDLKVYRPLKTNK
ncbi:amino acid permease 3-like [Pyrus ussuriensis x Pyrus communis]|uniref:Amino acid permease 3-like n=1 Tax=Pyrus ussuriensis x Pyrus communis TaxID=2448454 RepID=A0A5N5GTN9_9ROSA|nr:amino acid permease 3-like [Pyrus ussuriensis x Pyrus communis]